MQQILLKIANIPSSTYKYQVNNMNYKKEKDKELLVLIKEVFFNN